MGDARMPMPATALDHEGTIVTAVELSARSWLVGAQVAGVPRQCRQKLDPSAQALLDHLEHLRQRAGKAGKQVSRVVVAYEAGRDGFWLARWLIGRGIEVYVIQPSSVPVDRRARRAKTDALDVEMLLRTTLAWLRGEPRVCSMVPVPSEAEEDGRRPLRERQDLIRERLAITNRIDGLLATLGGAGYRPLRRDRRERLEALRQPGGGAVPAHAQARLAPPPRPPEAGAAPARRRCVAGARQGPAGPPPRPARAGARADPGVGGSARCRRRPGRGAGRRGGGSRPPAGGPERDRPGAGHLAGLGGVRAPVPESPGAGRLRGADRHPVRQRRQAARAGDRQGGQPPSAGGAGRAGLAVAALPAGERARRLVPASHPGRGRADAQGDDRRPGQETSRGLVAPLPRGRRAGGRGVEGRVGTEGPVAERPAPPRTDPRSADRRRYPRTRSGAVSQNGAAASELPLPDAGIVVTDRPIRPDARLDGHRPSSTRSSSAPDRSRGKLPLDSRRLIRGVTHEISRRSARP